MKFLFLSLLLLGSISLFAETNYQQEITKSFIDKLNNDEYVVLDFYAKWCGPCKKMDRDVFDKKEFKQFAIDHSIYVVKIDIDQIYENDLSYVAKRNLGIKALPSVFILSKDQLLDLLDDHTQTSAINLGGYSGENSVKYFTERLLKEIN